MRRNRFLVTLLALAACKSPDSSDSGQPTDATTDAGIDASAQDATDVAPPIDTTSVPDVSVDAPLTGATRAIAPLATSTVTSRTPTFHYLLSPTASAPHVEICTTRACDTVEQSLVATGMQATATTALSPGVHFWRLRDGSTTTPPWSFYVRNHGAAIDTSYGSVLDVNGDGTPDFAIGETQSNNQMGAVRVFVGTHGQFPTSPTQTIVGSEASGEFGWSVASAGDVNGDGFADVVIGAPFAAMGNGRAYLYLGSASGLAASPAVVVQGTQSMGEFGFGAVSAGDIDGDGYGDIAISAPDALSAAGQVTLYFGSADGLATARSIVLDAPGGAGSGFGGGVAAAGDVNGDGFVDLLVGATGTPATSGAAYLYNGRIGGPSTTPSVTLTANAGSSSQFGTYVGGGGDLNGDGYADVVVGAPATTNGSAYIYYGSASGTQSMPNVSIDGPDGARGAFGWAVTVGADLNGDGYDDFLVAAVCAPFMTDPDGGYMSCGSGRTYVFDGGPSGVATTASQTLIGSMMGDSFGWTLVGAGDLDGDGFGDLLVGAPAANSFDGAAFIYAGSASGIGSTPVATFGDTPASAANYGWCVAMRSARVRDRTIATL